MEQGAGERLLGILTGPVRFIAADLLAVDLRGESPGLALRALAGDLPGSLVNLGQGQFSFPARTVHRSPYFRRSATPTPRARASRSATSSDSLCRVPASKWAIYPCVTFVRAASFSWVQPFSSRSRLIIAPGLLAMGRILLL